MKKSARKNRKKTRKIKKRKNEKYESDEKISRRENKKVETQKLSLSECHFEKHTAQTHTPTTSSNNQKHFTNNMTSTNFHIHITLNILQHQTYIDKCRNTHQTLHEHNNISCSSLDDTCTNHRTQTSITNQHIIDIQYDKQCLHVVFR